MEHTRDAALVAAGGAAGTLVRYGLDASIGTVGALPLATLAVNLLGSLLLGLLVGMGARGRLRLLLGTGVLGGFTTYSAFAVQLHGLAAQGDLALGAAYALASVGGGLVLAAAGLRGGRRCTA